MTRFFTFSGDGSDYTITELDEMDAARAELLDSFNDAPVYMEQDGQMVPADDEVMQAFNNSDVIFFS
jgi:hypothetical protein